MKPLIPTRITEIIFAFLLAFQCFFLFETGITIKWSMLSYPGGWLAILIYLRGIAMGFASLSIFANFQRKVLCYTVAGTIFIEFIFEMITAHLNATSLTVFEEETLYLCIAMASIMIANKD